MSDPQQQSAGNPAVDYPEDGWLRGYFCDTECDVKGGARVPTGLRKNVDFMRLRDVGLHLLNPRPGMKVLDVGCADGATMVYCGLQGAEVYGQDLSAEQVAKANTFLRRYDLRGEAVVGDAASMTFPDNFFDGAISSDFFEHVTQDEKVRILREVRRVLKPGGVVAMKTPNLNYLRLSLFHKRVKAALKLHNPMRLVIPHTPGTDDPQHIGLTTRWELTRALTDAGFLNYRFFYAPLRRFGRSPFIETLSTEVPRVRDWLCEDLFCRAYKPIAYSHFPD